MTDLIIALAISQLALLGPSVLILQRGKIPGLVAVFSLCLIAYLLSLLSIFPENELLGYFLARLSTVRPLILWLIAFYLFLDNEKVSNHIWLLMGIFVLARAIGVPLYDSASEYSNFWFIIIYFIPQLILLGFAIHGVFLAISSYRIDLLEQRRRIRLLFLFGMGILTMVTTANSFFSFVDPFLDQSRFFSLTPLPTVVFPLYIFALTLGLNLTISRYGTAALTLAPSSEKKSTYKQNGKQQLKKVDLSLLDKLIEAMEEDKLYQESGLSISRLAEVLSMQEYQLRRVINQELNYRNFNQFLNHYRIMDSCRRLHDSRQDQLSIAEIALEVGYSSLSTFNKAFKEIKGVTPSQFRSSELHVVQAV
mgnify:CR=1 FL=1|tara:strand:+ start:462 stop:1556 length:1095 start_codon:yes stop_codon:yes gene_type:complete